MQAYQEEGAKSNCMKKIRVWLKFERDMNKFPQKMEVFFFFFLYFFVKIPRFPILLIFFVIFLYLIIYVNKLMNKLKDNRRRNQDKTFQMSILIPFLPPQRPLGTKAQYT
jgi:hypothetical protein